VADRQLVFGPFRLRDDEDVLWRDRERIALPPKSLALLRYLVAQAGRLVTKQELLEALWPDTHVAEGVLKVRVRELRAALGDDAGAPAFIETVHRRGYRFVATVGIAGATPDAESASSMRSQADVAGSAPIGRERELAALEDRFARALRGSRQVSFVTGEAGIGKTVLVDAFARRLAASVPLLARAHCVQHHGGGEAYHPMIEALRQLCEGPRRVEVRAALRRLAPTWLAQMPQLLEPGDDVALGRELVGATRERMLREMAETIEALSASEPLLLILEDLHWSDPSTLDLLAVVAHRREPARLAIVATFRPVDVILSEHPLRPLKRRLEQQQLAAEISLPFFGGDHIAGYLAQRLVADDVPEPLCDAVLERTGGNPLFVVSIVEHLLERGWLEVEDGRCVLRITPERIRAEVPAGLRPMIERQMERFSAHERRVLETASVIGDEFPVAAVAAAMRACPDDVELLCQEEVRRGPLLRPRGIAELADGSVSGRYGFAHTLHRDVLYGRLDGSRRADLHRSIGEWQEQAGASPAELARHFLEAGGIDASDRGVHYSRLAAERAAGLLAFAEAARHYEQALAARSGASEADERDRCELLIALGEAQERSGRLGPARETFARAAARSRALEGADELFARAALGMGRGHHIAIREDEELIAALEEALARLPEADAPLRALVLARLETALSPIAGEHPRRDRLAEEARAMARRLGDPDTFLWVLQYGRWGFIGRETGAELRASAHELTAFVARGTSAEHTLQLRLLLVSQLGELGEVAAARAALAAFRREADVAGVPWFTWFGLRLEFVFALQSGDVAAAERLSQEAFAFSERMDHPNVAAVFHTQQAHLLLLQGRFAELAPRLQRRIDASPRDFSARAMIASLYAQDGDAASARHVLDSLASDGFAVIPRDSLWLVILAQLADACVTVENVEHAAVLYDLLLPHAERVLGVGANLASVGHAARSLGVLAGVLGRWDEATQRLEVAVREHERMGALPWLAITWRDRGRVELARRRAGVRPRGTAGALEEPLARARGLAHAFGMAAVERDLHGIEQALGSKQGRQRAS
jgi:DNA-binding winged helix-turn-helix (wHTH) protein/tetratricopeptide (TPR) repeat protein